MATKKKATAVASKSKAGKTATKKPAAAKKAATKGSVAKNNTASKKATPKKDTKTASASKTKKAVKKEPAKKAASKLSNKKSPVSQKKTSGAKTAKVVTKKVAAKKPADKKPTVNTKKSTSKKEKTISGKKATPAKKSQVNPIKQVSSGHTSSKSPAENHKAELKKAMAKVKAKKEEKKTQKEFVMPKTNTDKARKYEPEFTKSVLDTTPPENNGPTMRYSDSELQEFKELITRKLETAKKELGYLQGLITRKDQMGGDESDNRYMTMEDGSLSMEREQLSQMASRQITFIDHLEKAMMRIENKTYGICRVTGKLIDKARLRAVPHATLSIEAKMGTNK
ncbi:MAG TPA: TraR/DksA C4-type zinc finger protein [Hanamia sp.]|nr:TraR/DksA C4-type zinc finger protein [Hanamia sp.]